MDEETDEEAVYDFGAQEDDDGRIFHSDHPDVDLDFEEQLLHSSSKNKQQQQQAESFSASSKYFTFNQAAHHLMVHSILSSRLPSVEEITQVDPDIVLRVSKNNLGKQSQSSAIKTRWKDIQERLVADIDLNGEEHLCHKDNPALRIPYREQWGEIIDRAHLENGRHLSWKQTMKNIQKQWCTNIRRYGILDAFVQNVVHACPGCDFTRVSVRKKKEEYKFSQRMTVAARDLPRALEEIAVKYKVLLRIDRADRVSRSFEVKDYVCHRGRSKRGRRMVAEAPKDGKIRDRKSCRIGCPFRIRVMIPIQFADGSSVVRDEGLAHILLSPFHDGHRPGTKEDLLSLPPHPSAIRCCENDLNDNAGNVQALVRGSASRAPLLYFQASEGDQASYRFFLLPKDVEQLAYRMKSRDSISEDDWAALDVEAQALESQGKVIFYQPYAPDHPDEDKKPFVLVIQDPWMRDCAKRFSMGSSWVISKILRSNQFGLPLYAGMVPNQVGEELLVWLMLCSSDVGSSHESAALKVTLQEVFKWLGNVRPSALVIEKSISEFRAVQAAVSKDPFSWRDNILGGEQVACFVLLCWFHVRRDWMENLLTDAAITPAQRRELYQALNNMMLATTETAFDMLLHSFNEKHKDLPAVCEYVNQNWAGVGCVWRRMWPKFGRMFEHGEIDTTHFAEKLWNFIKHTLLRGRSKCNVIGFLGALVGLSTSVHGETLLDHSKQKQALIDSGKLSLQAAGLIRSQKKLIGGEYMLELYESDVTMVEADDEVSLQFRMRSEILPDNHHIVSMQNLSCDCLEVLSPTCKHLQGIRLIIDKYFPHLCASLLAPQIDETIHSPEVFSLQTATGDPLELHFAADDPMDLCGSDGLRSLSLQCSDLKAELRRLLAIASSFCPTETAIVLHSVRALRHKLQAFDTLERPPRTTTTMTWPAT